MVRRYSSRVEEGTDRREVRTIILNKKAIVGGFT
jgi:hypothetical protein